MRLVRWISLMVPGLGLLIGIVISLPLAANPQPACILLLHGADYYRADPHQGVIQPVNAADENLLTVPDPNPQGASPDGIYSLSFDGLGPDQRPTRVSVGLRGHVYKRTLLTADAIDAAWSPDSQHLALTWFGDDMYWHLAITDPTGRNAKVYRLNALYNIVNSLYLYDWSADGRYIALTDIYDLNLGERPYFFFDVDTGQLSRIAIQVEVAQDLEKMPTAAFAWSPKGHQFAYRRVPPLTRSNPSPSAELVIGTPSEPMIQAFSAPYMETRQGMPPKWSADGNYVSIMYTGNYRVDPYTTYSTIAGIHGEYDADLPGLVNDQMDPLANFVAYSNNAGWAGSRYVFLQNNPLTATNSLIGFDTAQNRSTTLASGAVEVKYDSASKHLAVQVRRQDGLVVEMMDVDGSHRMTVAHGAANVRDAQWWPGGLTVTWDQAADTKHPMSHLTWITADGMHTGTSIAADYVGGGVWSDNAPYLFYFEVNRGLQAIHVVDPLNGTDTLALKPFPIPAEYTQGMSFSVTLAPSSVQAVIQLPGSLVAPSDFYVLSLRTGQLKQVARNLSNASGAIWSPDSTQFALSYQDPNSLYWADVFSATGDRLAHLPALLPKDGFTAISYTYCR